MSIVYPCLKVFLIFSFYISISQANFNLKVGKRRMIETRFVRYDPISLCAMIQLNICLDFFSFRNEHSFWYDHQQCHLSCKKVRLYILDWLISIDGRNFGLQLFTLFHRECPPHSGKNGNQLHFLATHPALAALFQNPKEILKFSNTLFKEKCRMSGFRPCMLTRRIQMAVQIPDF